MKALAWPHEASQGQRKEGDSVLQDCSKEKEETSYERNTTPWKISPCVGFGWTFYKGQSDKNYIKMTHIFDN